MADMNMKFSETKVGDVFDDMVTKPSVVQKGAKIRQIIDLMIENPLSRKAYVVDSNEKLLGMVNTETLLRLVGYRIGVRKSGGVAFYQFLRDSLKEEIDDMMTPVIPIKKDTMLTDAIELMVKQHLNDLPIVDEDGKLIGEMISLNIFKKARDLFED